MFRKILVANDGTPGAFKALTASFDVAQRYRSELHMIIIEELPRFPGTIDEVEGEIEAADRRFAPVLSTSKELALRQGLNLHCHVLPGHAASRIVEFTKARGFDLRITGFGGHSALNNRIIGSTINRVIALAPCTVMVVK
jgi:nucleotide-binding universal stress UspA family protein